MTRRHDKGSLTKPYAAHPGVMFAGKIITRPDRLDIPLRRKKPTVYNIWNDLFHEAVPEIFISKALAVTAGNSPHIFLILTKRPKRMAEYFAGENWNGLLRNIYFGLTICNQPEADEKIPIFLQVPGKKFLSIEPMLGEIDISKRGMGLQCESCMDRSVHWCVDGVLDAVILGGETLGNRPGREMKLEWALSIAEQCRAAGVPLFVKQLHIKGKVSKNINDWPGELQRRELPWSD